MSRVLPILFNTDMVQAILDKRKTMTRRVVREKVAIVKKDQEINKNQNGKFELYNITPRCGIPQNVFFKPPYQPGDILYVRETWSDHYIPNDDGKPELKYCYKADGIDIKSECLPGETNRWYPSIHMPKEAARIWLKVTDVRVEQLQEIDGSGTLAEGIDNGKSNPAMGKRWKNMQRIAFENLWNSTIKESDIDQYGWDANPWVWVIEFERCEKPESEEQHDR